MRTLLAVFALLLFANPMQAAPSQTSSALRVYFIDVEGGQATLFVTPAGKSLLIDTGWDNNSGRDADRIVAAAKDAGISKIDYVLITHFHQDHVGGVPQLLARLPVGVFFDHGANRELTAQVEKDFSNYEKAVSAAKVKRVTAKPGDQLPVEGMDIKVISADGQLINKPLSGAGETNSFCKASANRPADQTENARSLGVLITFGKLRILDLGDLTWDKEMELMCPVNKLGKVDILIVSHHGWEQSSSPALVHAIHPRIAIMDNGAKKGGSTPVLDVVRQAPGLEALWQLHYSEEGGEAHNTPAEYIANLSGGEDAGNSLKLTVDPAGKFSVTNSRTGKSVDYPAR